VDFIRNIVIMLCNRSIVTFKNRNNKSTAQFNRQSLYHCTTIRSLIKYERTVVYLMTCTRTLSRRTSATIRLQRCLRRSLSISDVRARTWWACAILRGWRTSGTVRIWPTPSAGQPCPGSWIQLYLWGKSKSKRIIR